MARRYLSNVEKPDANERMALAALQDAERLCGVPHLLRQLNGTIAFAEHTAADFSAHAGD